VGTFGPARFVSNLFGLKYNVQRNTRARKTTKSVGALNFGQDFLEYAPFSINYILGVHIVELLINGTSNAFTDVYEILFKPIKAKLF